MVGGGSVHHGSPISYYMGPQRWKSRLASSSLDSIYVSKTLWAATVGWRIEIHTSYRQERAMKS
jgi:hypothetical protein